MKAKGYSQIFYPQETLPSASLMFATKVSRFWSMKS